MQHERKVVKMKLNDADFTAQVTNLFQFFNWLLFCSVYRLVTNFTAQRENGREIMEYADFITCDFFCPQIN